MWRLIYTKFAEDIQPSSMLLVLAKRSNVPVLDVRHMIALFRNWSVSKSKLRLNFDTFDLSVKFRGRVGEMHE